MENKEDKQSWKEAFADVVLFVLLCGGAGFLFSTGVWTAARLFGV
jgi:hypothetical protein